MEEDRETDSSPNALVFQRTPLAQWRSLRAVAPFGLATLGLQVEHNLISAYLVNRMGDVPSASSFIRLLSICPVTARRWLAVHGSNSLKPPPESPDDPFTNRPTRPRTRIIYAEPWQQYPPLVDGLSIRVAYPLGNQDNARHQQAVLQTQSLLSRSEGTFQAGPGVEVDTSIPMAKKHL